MGARRWDGVVVGSGIGGLAAAAALSRTGRRVLVLERHTVAGGLTHTFARGRWSWDVGVHYVGDPATSPPTARLLARLGVEGLRFERMPDAYDRLHFPDGFRIDVRTPESAWFDALAERFPDQAAGLARYRDDLVRAAEAGPLLFASRAAPWPLGRLLRLARRRRIDPWLPLTTARAIGRSIDDPRLAAVLAAQWGDHGGRPDAGSFVIHALVTRSFRAGAAYPVGGAASIAPAFVRPIEAAGGALRTGAEVRAIRVTDGTAVGVELAGGERVDADWVVSDIGAADTIRRLLPPPWPDHAWARTILGLAPNVANVALYLGFDGDIADGGATAANDWWYDHWSMTPAVWSDPFEQARPPSVFVSFPSLKDPAHRGGAHTGEVHAWIDAAVFDPWRTGGTDDDYLALKDAIGRALLATFSQHYPALAPRVRHVEVSTPLTMERFTGHARGGFYGLETTPRRLACDALGPRTPVRRLVLAGQDACVPGIEGAMTGGVLAAGVVDPRIFGWLR